MLSVSTLQTRIIKMIREISNLSQLTEIHKHVQSSIAPNKVSEQLPWQDSIVNMKDHISFNEVIDEQGYRHLTYEETCDFAQNIQWGISLDEMLKLLD